MTTLSDIRTRVRKDLHDTDSGDYRWTDSQLDRHIEHALADLDLEAPRELTATIATTEGNRDVSIAALTELVAIEAAEYPVGDYPASYVRFSTWGTTLTLLMPGEPDGSDVKLYYTATHVLDGSGSTIPAALEDALAMAAAGYAAIELANFATNQVTTGANVPVEYAKWGQAWLTAWRQLLKQHSRSNRVRPQRLYVPA